MHVIVDTNVPKVANGQSRQAAPQCVSVCVQKIKEVQQQDILVLDESRLILKEYINNLRPSGQPGVGDAFLKWVLTNQHNLKHCELVAITPNDPNDKDSFEEFPQDATLANFDRSDRKFVAVALVHPNKPPIFNAVDSDWWNFRQELATHGVQIQFLCPEAMPTS